MPDIRPAGLPIHDLKLYMKKAYYKGRGIEELWGANETPVVVAFLGHQSPPRVALGL
jgi:hypothetical protein